MKKAAGEVLTAKQAPHRPGTAPALGLRAGNDVSPLYRRPTWKGRTYHVIHQLAAHPAILRPSRYDRPEKSSDSALRTGETLPATSRIHRRPLSAQHLHR